MCITDQTTLLQSLRQKVRRIETAARSDSRCLSLGCTALDQIAPEGGLAAGTLHEWLAAAPGSGAEVLSLIAAANACADGGALVVVDSERCFYPPAAARWGIQLDHTIVLRVATPRDGAWAIDQALRCPAVAAVWGPLKTLDERWLRRFQLSAEQSGCVGLFVRPATVVHHPSWCDVRWLCRGLPAGRSLPGRTAGPVRLKNGNTSSTPQQIDHQRRIQVQLLRARGGRAGATAILNIDFNSGIVRDDSQQHEPTLSQRLARQLAHPTVGRTAARA